MAVQWFKTNNLVKEYDLYEKFMKERQEQLEKRNLLELSALFPRIRGLRWSKMKNSEYWAIRKWHCITISYLTWNGICANNGEIQPWSNSYKKFVDLSEEYIKLFRERVNSRIEAAGCDYNNLHPNQTVFDPCRYLAMYWTFLDIKKDTTALRYYPNSKTRALAAKVFKYNAGEDPFHMNGKYCNPIEKTDDQPEEKKSVDVTVVPEEISIRDLDLSGKAYNPLWRHGIRTLGDILKLTTNDILHIRNVGITVFREIAKKVEEYGYFYPNTNKNVAAQPIGSCYDKIVTSESIPDNEDDNSKAPDYQAEYLRVLSEKEALKAEYDQLETEYVALNRENCDIKRHCECVEMKCDALEKQVNGQSKDGIFENITKVVNSMKEANVTVISTQIDGYIVSINTKVNITTKPVVGYAQYARRTEGGA